MFNPTTVKDLLAELKPALDAIAEAQGLQVSVGTARYTRGSVRLTISFDAATESGEPVDFRADALFIGLPQDCWNTTIGVGMTQYRIVSINLRRKKYPVTIERKNFDGSVVQLKMTADKVRQLLGA